jgi:hypothetical protein
MLRTFSYMQCLICSIEFLGMHRKFFYRIALHYVLKKFFHPLKSYVTVPLFSANQTLFELFPVGSESYRIRKSMELNWT